MKYLLSALFFLSVIAIHAQDKKDEPAFGIAFSGFVKTDAFYDTRQTVSIREGHFLLYPDNLLPDANKNDINDKANFNLLSIQSRLKGTISGPEAFGGKTSGVLEADFFGNENSAFSDVNGFRLRHAFVKINWASAEVLVGQYWHPMFIAESFPGVISFNTGAPFQPFSRNPQVRITQSFGALKLIACIFSQRDFVSIGPEYSAATVSAPSTASAVASSKFIRNSGIPNLHFQAQHKFGSPNCLVGAGVDYKTITPELFTMNSGTKGTAYKYASDQTLSSISAVGFVNLNLEFLTVKVEGIFAQNAYDLSMIGGYGICRIADTSTGAKKFTNLNTSSFWAEIQTNDKNMQVGIFFGYTKNMGTWDTIVTTYSRGATMFARGATIDYVYRIAPRVVFISGKLSAALEGEYTYANYGTPDTKARVTNGKGIANTRVVCALIYNF
jgi:hypothetical protein